MTLPQPVLKKIQRIADTYLQVFIVNIVSEFVRTTNVVGFAGGYITI